MKYKLLKGRVHMNINKINDEVVKELRKGWHASGSASLAVRTEIERFITDYIVPKVVKDCLGEELNISCGTEIKFDAKAVDKLLLPTPERGSK